MRHAVTLRYDAAALRCCCGFFFFFYNTEEAYQVTMAGHNRYTVACRCRHAISLPIRQFFSFATPIATPMPPPKMPSPAVTFYGYVIVRDKDRDYITNRDYTNTSRGFTRSSVNAIRCLATPRCRARITRYVMPQDALRHAAMMLAIAPRQRYALRCQRRCYAAMML